MLVERHQICTVILAVFAERTVYELIMSLLLSGFEFIYKTLLLICVVLQLFKDLTGTFEFIHFPDSLHAPEEPFLLIFRVNCSRCWFLENRNDWVFWVIINALGMNFSPAIFVSRLMNLDVTRSYLSSSNSFLWRHAFLNIQTTLRLEKVVIRCNSWNTLCLIGFAGRWCLFQFLFLFFFNVLQLLNLHLWVVIQRRSRRDLCNFLLACDLEWIVSTLGS